MATFSLGTSGVTPGAPGVYINEQPGKAANANLADFSTVYMLVETDENVPVTRFPFNKPTAVTSLNDYKELIRVGTSTVPEGRIPLLSYNCVNEFFQNAQVGDLRVVRVGTPNQIVEIELFPSATKLNSTSLPSALMAGNKVYLQVQINGLPVVAGDGSTGYTADGEWLGVPVTIPVNYVAGDEVNNRKIAEAMRLALAEAIESNPAVRSSVYVRESGLVNDKKPATNSQNSYVTIAATTFDGNVSVVTQVMPVGSNFVFEQSAYDIENIVGGSVDLVRVPQDYTQCIATAFDGQQDQGYLVTPTAYAQFDAKGRAQVGAAAAAHCENNNYKWMALADPGPFLVTDINEYSKFVPHQAAANLETGKQYLVDNAIYKWTGSDVSYNKLSYQAESSGQSDETAVRESANLVSDATKVGLLDNAQYTINAVPNSLYGRFSLDTDQYWPVGLPIQKVSLTGADTVGNDFQSASVQGTASPVNLNGQEVYVIATPKNLATTGDYSLNTVYLALSPVDATNIYNQVMVAGGSDFMGVIVPNGAVYIGTPTGDTALVSYPDPNWDFPVTINGQTSDLVENISGANAGVNTLHLPGTLQDPTETYRLSWVSRTIFNPQLTVAPYTGSEVVYAGAATFNVLNHGLASGQKIYFTQPISTASGATTQNLVSQTTKLTSNAYWVKVVDANNFVLSNSLGNYSISSFLKIPTGYSVGTLPTIFYTQVRGGGLTTLNVTELITLPMIRARKYEFDSSSIFNKAADASLVPGTGAATDPGASIYLNNSSLILGVDQINPYGEDLTSPTLCDWLDELILVNPTLTPSAQTDNAYCAPTVDQFFQPEAYLVPAINPIYGGSYDASGTGTTGPLVTLTITTDPGGWTPSTTTFNVALNTLTGTGSGAVATVTTDALGFLQTVTISAGGNGYVNGDTVALAGFAGTVLTVASVSAQGIVTLSSPYALAAGQANGDSGNDLVAIQSRLVGVYYDVTGTNDQVGSIQITNVGSGYTPGTYVTATTGGSGTGCTLKVVVGAGGTITSATVVSLGSGYTLGDALNITLLPGAAFAATVTSLVAGVTPDGTQNVVVGDRVALTYDGSTYSWVVVPAASLGGDLTEVGQPCYGSQVELTFQPEEAVPTNLWRFDAITSTEIIDSALRGVGFNGVPQAVFVDAGVDNVNRLLADSQRYGNPFGFIAYYGPYIENGAGQFIPPSPYVTGVAVRRYRSEGYQFPPAGVKYQLADAYGVQIPINSAQQNLLNPKGCNAIRTLPGYPQDAVFIWGGRTRLLNPDDAQQKLYQFVNTRVILNVVYGSLRTAFDNQIFNVIDGFGVIFNQIISVGNSVLNQLYVRGALFGARPSNAFQVICDSRINPPEDIENGIVNAKVFVTPVPTLERIQIDLIRVAIGKMQQELDIQGLGQSNQ